MSLKLHNISKIYPNGVKALDGISLEIKTGEFLVLVGPSGCGKSTLLKIIAGLDTANSGEISINDIKVTNSKPSERGIGMVFQNYALYPHLNVFDNIAFPLKIKKLEKQLIESKVKEIAELLELSEYLDRKPKELSGGQRQRVALGRALIKEPNLFLFDEPLSNLDAKLRHTMRDEIVNIHRKIGISSVYVTHDQIEAMTMADKIAVMNKGNIMQFDTPVNIYNNPINLFTAEFIGSPKINTINIDKISKLEFLNSKDNNQKYICVRPEDISISKVKKDNSIDVIYQKSEYHGNEWIYYFKFENETIRVKSKEELNVESSEFYLTFNKYFMFDSSEKRIH